MSKTKVSLKDGWTTDQDYKDLYQADEEVLEILELLDLNKSTSLLDNACGNGEISIQSALRNPNLRIYGYDALEGAIAEARRRIPKRLEKNLNFDTAWADDLPLSNGSVDRAVFRNALHHIKEPRVVFNEIARCLEVGGLFVMQTPFNYWEESFSSFLTDIHLLMDNSHRRYYRTQDEIQEDLRSSGFRNLSFTPSTYSFPFVTKPMRDLVVEHRYEDRLQLEQVDEEKWTVTLYWSKVTARKK